MAEEKSFSSYFFFFFLLRSARAKTDARQAAHVSHRTEGLVDLLWCDASTIEQELTAIHWAVLHFRPYLYGRKFLIRTDHRPLVYLFSIKNPTSKLTRMRWDMEEYDFSIEYIKGKSNVVADAFSRIPLDMNVSFRQLLHFNGIAVCLHFRQVVVQALRIFASKHFRCLFVTHWHKPTFFG